MGVYQFSESYKFLRIEFKLLDASVACPETKIQFQPYCENKHFPKILIQGYIWTVDMHGKLNNRISSGKKENIIYLCYHNQLIYPCNFNSIPPFSITGRQMQWDNTSIYWFSKKIDQSTNPYRFDLILSYILLHRLSAPPHVSLETQRLAPIADESPLVLQLFLFII